MNTKASKTTSSKRDKNKRLLGAWVDKKIFEEIKALSVKKGHGNVSSIIAEALTEYLRVHSEDK
jgi:hypothetical protein